jgi:hypothetical protein
MASRFDYKVTVKQLISCTWIELITIYGTEATAFLADRAIDSLMDQINDSSSNYKFHKKVPPFTSQVVFTNINHGPISFEYKVKEVFDSCFEEDE